MQSDFHLTWAQSTFNATPKVDSFVMQFSTSQEHVYWMEIYSSDMLWQKECLYRTSRLHKIDLTALDKIKGLLCHGSVGYTNAAYTNAADSVPVHGVKHGVTGQPHYTAACGMQMYPSNDSICTQSSVKIADSNICKNAWISRQNLVVLVKFNRTDIPHYQALPNKTKLVTASAIKMGYTATCARIRFCPPSQQ